MSTYKEQDIENLLAHLREGVAPDSVSALVDDVQIECDGAKEGCASKVALSAGLAVEAACLALEGGGIHAQDGILDESFDRLIAHLGELVCVGMGSTNSTIVHIMKDEKGYAASC